MNLNDTLKHVRKLVDTELDKLLPVPAGDERRVVEAMRYSCIGAGKALRPFMVMESAKLFGVPYEESIRTACALEMVHSYSLIHDDLPCMDDDDMRRGKPSCHRQFDEATAVLAGDALLTRAFEVLADPHTHADAGVRVSLVAALAHGAGMQGMVGGQMLDLIAETARDVSLSDIQRIQALKTGALFNFAMMAGGVLGRGSEEQKAALRAYANGFGLAFQMTDDILDATGDAAKVGKTLGKDAAAHKGTYVSLMGIDAAREKAGALIKGAVQALDIFGEKAVLLKQLAEFVLKRDH